MGLTDTVVAGEDNRKRERDEVYDRVEVRLCPDGLEVRYLQDYEDWYVGDFSLYDGEGLSFMPDAAKDIRVYCPECEGRFMKYQGMMKGSEGNIIGRRFQHRTKYGCAFPAQCIVGNDGKITWKLSSSKNPKWQNVDPVQSFHESYGPDLKIQD